MRNINQTRTPTLLGSLRRLQQFLKILTDEELITPSHRLISQYILQPIQQGIGRQRQSTNPAAIAGLTKQHLNQMLHIQLAMPPTACHVLAGQKQIPSLITEAIRFVGEAAPWRNRAAHR